MWRSGRGPTCLFLDGELYLERVGAAELMAPFGLNCAWVSYGTPEDRQRDYVCSAAFGRFITEELLPWLDEEILLIVGLSLSGLAAAHLGLRFPASFPRVIAQSPSAWWNDE